MLVQGPQRGLFLGLLAAGASSLLALDVVFAPAAFGSPEADAAAEPPPSVSAPATPSAPLVPPPTTSAPRVPPQARVPTIVARFDREAKEPSDQSAIRALAAAMIEDHDATIVLEGHSDTIGAQDYNTDLSLERAMWVKSRLVDMGISPERIQTEGLGSTRPLREDMDAQAVNRRVEVRWLGR